MTLTSPQLTVVSQPAYEIGHAAAELWLPPAPTPAASCRVLTPTLIVRESSNASRDGLDNYEPGTAAAIRLRGRRRPRSRSRSSATTATSPSIASPPTRSSSGCAPHTTTFEAQPRSGFPDRLFDVARPYGSVGEPELGQLLFPERRMPGVEQTRRCTATRARVAARLLGAPDADIEHWGHLIFKPPRVGRRDAVAPGRGVLGSRPVVPRGRRVDAARRRRCRQRLPLVRPGFAPRRGARAPPPRRRSGRPHPGARRRASTPRPRCPCPCPRAVPASTTRAPSTAPRPNTTDRRRRAWANEFQLRAGHARRPGRPAVGARRVTTPWSSALDRRASDRSTSGTPRSSTRASTRGPRRSRTRPARAARAAAPTAGARERRTAGSNRASGSCSPTSRGRASCATSG